MEWIEAKSIVQNVKANDEYIGRDFNINIYRGCSHGCIYCDSRSECYHLEDFGRVRAKKDAIAMIDRELRGKRKRGLVGTGAMSDPYNTCEEEHRLTRGALEAIARYGFGVSIITKSPLVARDTDLFSLILKNAPAAVHVTITALDDDLARRIEPGVAPSSERFRAIGELSAAGVHVGVMITPVLPFITDMPENIAGIVERAATCGARHAVCFPGMTLRAGNREYYYAALDRQFSGLRRRYEVAYGDAYQCSSPYSEAVWAAYADACRKHRLLSDFGSINAAIRSMAGGQQLSFLP